jgi:hypothetical protein
MEPPAHSSPDTTRAYGLRSVNKTGYRGVDGNCVWQRARYSFSHVKQRITVIVSVSEAIQKSWIASSLALLAMTQSYIPATSNARVIANNNPPKSEGAGNAGRPLRPLMSRF